MSPRDPEPTRHAVLDAAGALLESGGPDAVTMRAVGAAAGVSRMASYRHFETKADLLAALALSTLTDLGARIRRAAATGDDPAEQLRRGCLAYLQFALDNPRHYLLVFGAAPLEDPGPMIEAAADDGLRAIQELVEHAHIREGLTAPRETATALWVFLHGLAHLQITRHLHEPRTLDGDTRLAELLAVALASPDRP